MVLTSLYVIIVVATIKWYLKELDVNNICDFNEEVQVYLFLDYKWDENMVCKLNKSLYNFKQVDNGTWDFFSFLQTHSFNQVVSIILCLLKKNRNIIVLLV